MQFYQINRIDTGLFSQQAIDLCYNQERFIPFIQKPFSLNGFEDVIDTKSASYSSENRSVLVETLKQQYADIEIDSRVVKNLDLLTDSATFTITTGHQLSLFTGPLYFIYKILHVIRQTEELKIAYPHYNFVPIYWMASEDHDFEEIQSLNLYGKKLTWERESEGAIGRMSLDGLEKVKAEFAEFFSNSNNTAVLDLIQKLDGNSYGEAFFKFINELFGRFGLIILDGDHKNYKNLFKPIMKHELETSFAVKEVERTNEELEEEGLKIQVHAREINLFYLGQKERIRIVKEGEFYHIKDKKYTQSEILQLLDSEPENFSPNVVLRPVYQEVILPNLNYIGGLGELAYWLQLKGVFKAVNVPYPFIQARNSFLIIDGVTKDRMNKVSMTIDQLFMDTDHLKRKFVEEHHEEELDFTKVEQSWYSLKNNYMKLTDNLDLNIQKSVESDLVRIEKQVGQLKEKLFKGAKSKHEKSLKMIDQIKDKLFPEGALQERVVNSFQFSPTGNYNQFINQIYHHIQPMSPDFMILIE